MGRSKEGLVIYRTKQVKLRTLKHEDWDYPVSVWLSSLVVVPDKIVIVDWRAEK